MSHANSILSHLKKGRSLTKIQSLKMFGCWNTGARILELRGAGHNIITTMIQRVNKSGDIVRFAQYKLKTQRG